MITLKQAINEVQRSKPSDKIIGIAETDDIFIMLLDNGGESYVTVNKKTGNLGRLWFWEYAELSEKGKTRVLKQP